MKHERLNERTRKRYYVKDGKDYTYSYYYRAFFRRIRHADPTAEDPGWLNIFAFISITCSAISSVIYLYAIIFSLINGLDSTFRTVGILQIGLCVIPIILTVWIVTTPFALASKFFGLTLLLSLLKIVLFAIYATMLSLAISIEGAIYTVALFGFFFAMIMRFFIRLKENYN